MLIRFRYKNSIHEYFFQNVLLCLEATWKSFKWTNKLNNCNSKHSSLLYNVECKEVCNRGVACSLLKLGSLEITVIASLFQSGLHSFLCGKNNVIRYSREQQVMLFFDKKRPKIFMMPNWFFYHLQLFLL